ncbi:HEAT repeat-containing protein 1 [Diaphorina citri]|uniref:HEAT repeat-containing protein 1 n=1 Tax=Diaphorina citri TaxID=121845 RepID=A0A3Q0J595_DIACI|nr:HEAT repeat-containing protein 1 [Diaphorina citri]
MTAATSLKEQLRKLRAPQTNLLRDVKKRVSFMFDADKAATITRATFYEIGKSGLNELIALDSSFEKFADSLFNESTLYFQRTVESKEVNVDIDIQIKELLYHLIPYFSIRPAHCVLEWLIVRYNIHMFNTDDLMFFLLPYYHTKLFARALQVVDIRSHASRWSWLYKVRKECIPLDRTTLFMRCSNDAFLLKLICHKTEEAVQMSTSPAKLSTLINFYTLCLVGVIQNASPLEDLHISHMVPSLIRALESGVRTFVLSAFVVLNFMMAKTKLKPKVVKSFVKKALKVKMNVHEEQTLLFLSIYQKYPGLILPPVSLKTLAKKEWFIKSLMKISQNPAGYDVLPLCYQVIKQCIMYVKQHQKPGMSDEEGEMLKKIKLLDCRSEGTFQSHSGKINKEQADVSSAQSKYWAGMLVQCYDILDKINALIDSTVFVNVIRKLLKHKTLSLRKRCLDMLNWRLQQKHIFQQEDLLKLVKPLVSLAVNSEQVTSIEAQLNQQTALISLKLFVRTIGEEHTDIFIDIVNQLMEVFEKQHEPPVTASLILCIAEMCSVLKAHTLTILPTFMPKLISCLSCHQSCDVITLGVVSSLLKVVEHLSMFMSPYLMDILAEVCVLDTASWSDTSKGVAIRTKLGYLKSKLANDIPGRVLMSSVAACYARLIASKNYQATTTLLHILGDSFSSSGFLYNNEVTDFFINALDFRVVHSDVGEDNISIVEASVISAFVKLVLKLSESNFKPLFNKLYDWAFRASNEMYKDRVITFFILTSHVAEALKSLFVLFAGVIVKDCSVILDKTQVAKHAELYLPEKEKNAILLDAVLATLLNYPKFVCSVCRCYCQKLSESNFKPLFNKLYDWAFRASNEMYKDRVITFFILTSHVAEALKSLFVLFAGVIVKDCSVILDKTQVAKHAELYLPEKEKNAILLDAVLATLLSIFTHDVHQFMTKERFNLLMQHLVDQLENKLPDYEARCRRLVQPCIVQFAASSSDDLQWKNLNYEILLKTRDNDSYVRLMSLECVLLLATKLGDNFLPLLPETVPFLAELLEDENEHVEKACHKVVQEMEQLLGEPISKYF